MDDNFQVLTVGAGIIVIPGDESLDMYADLLDSILLAQLVANKKCEKMSSVNWYDTYVSVLDDFWLRQQKSHQTWQRSGSVDESALAFFSDALGNDALPETQVIGSVLGQVAQISGDDPAIQRLRSFMKVPVAIEPVTASAPSDAVHLLVAVANSPTSYTSAFVEFETRRELGQNPFQQAYKTEDIQGLVHVRHSRATLAEGRYGDAREAIARKIRDKRADNVAVLSLPGEMPHD
ncbi:hypothetical protein J3Q09_24445 [Pseudomonas sp. R4-83]|uniref:hypothetical protein n=1 Tax=unclassified Pseudomonas TaxID=196821 RepID=UPI003DA9B50F